MSRLSIQSEKPRYRYRGTAVVEAALVFPVLLLLTMGAIEYGWLFLKAQQITNASRQAARLAIRPDSTNADVLANIDFLMTGAGMGDSGYSVNLTPADISLPGVGEIIEVEITAPCANLVLIDAGFLPVPANIGATVVMTKEGP